MTTLQTVFAKAKADDRAALVGYLPAGFPTQEGAIAAATAMVEAGCDVIEIGLPYTDPLMDGPTIQDAVHRALVDGTRIADVFAHGRGRRRDRRRHAGHDVLEPRSTATASSAFARDLANAGGAGHDHARPDARGGRALAGGRRRARTSTRSSWSRSAPPTSASRPSPSAARGFVYAASLMGVTGAREPVDIGGRRAWSSGPAGRTPTCRSASGSGVGTGAQAAEVAGFADGVIVGSAFIRRMLDAPDEAAGLAAVRELGAELAAGVRG